MAAIHRRSQRAPVSRLFTLATADDLDGTVDNSEALDVTGADRIIIIQRNDGTAGTGGIDVVEVSHDGGENWSAATDVLPIDADDKTGTVQANGALNAAGVEPTLFAAFKLGPYSGPTAIRIVRDSDVNANSDEWATGSPSVVAFLVGGNTGGTPSALA